MKMIRGTLKLALILYICAALSGVYVLSASAKITPHDGGDDTTLITIVKGDTLWDLCQRAPQGPTPVARTGANITTSPIHTSSIPAKHCVFQSL